MKTNKLKLGAVFTIAALWSVVSLGSSPGAPDIKVSVPEATSVSDASQVAPVKAELPISISTTSFIYGPVVKDPASKLVTEQEHDAQSGILTQHLIGAKYKLSDKVGIVPTLDFYYQLTDPDAKQLHKREFRMRDSFVKVTRGGLVDTKIQGGHGLSLDGDFRFYVPSSKSSRDNNNIGGLRLSLIPNLQFANSPFSITAMNWARFWIQTKSADARGNGLPRVAFYTGPQLNYQISDRVTAFVLYETALTVNTKGQSDADTLGFSNADFEPGLEIKVHNRVTLTPYLNWYTSQRLETTTMNLQANINFL